MNFKKIKSSYKQQGSSLLEVMISIVILAFFMLGNSSLMISTIENNRQSKRVSAATNLALDKLEVMRGLTYGLVVNGTDGPLTQTGANAGVGAIYTRTWTVADDTPITDTKTVSVTSSWTDKEGNHSIQLQSIISP